MYFKIANDDGATILEELARELGCDENLDRAFRTLRAVVWAWRNHLPFEKALKLLQVLPLCVQSLFVEHWVVHQNRADHQLDIESLIAESRRLDKSSSIQDFTTHDQAKQAIYAVFRVLGRHLSEIELKSMVDAGLVESTLNQ